MRRLLSFVILISILLLQLHGLTHSFADSDHKNHHCAICETQAHNPVIQPTSISIKIVESPQQEFTFVELPLVIKTALLPSNSPRAPPINI